MMNYKQNLQILKNVFMLQVVAKVHKDTSSGDI